MARIMVISSQVARGHVGLSAIVPACQALGHEVIALPTILLSNHPGHPHASGERIAPAALERMLDALDANSWLSDIDAVLTGYLPSAEHVQFAVEAVTRVDQVLLYCYHYEPATGSYSLVAMNAVRLGGAVTMLMLVGFIAISLRRDGRATRPPDVLKGQGV